MLGSTSRRGGDLEPKSEHPQGLRVVVTGGSGFIGTNAVASFLAGGADVLNIDIAAPRQPAHAPHWCQLDILEAGTLREAFDRFRPNLVVHLAARADLDERNNVHGYAANIDGVANVIDAIAAVGSVKRSIFASSRLVCRLGYQPKHDRDYDPSTMYGLSKVKGEELVREASPALGSWIIIRPTGIWGPWFRVPYRDFFHAIRTGIYVHPGGRVVRKSYGYVENTVHQIRRLGDVPDANVGGRTFYVADYDSVEVREWARLIQIGLGARRIRTMPTGLLKVGGRIGDIAEKLGMGHAPLTSFRVTNMMSDMLYDLSALEAIVGPLPFTLEEGVKRTISWLDDPGTQTSGQGWHRSTNEGVS